jgi:FkbM family methyltransferase
MSVHDHAQFLQRLSASGHRFDCLYDVGASIGGWTCAAQKACPGARFELFEPLAGRNPEMDAAARYAEIDNYGLHRIALSDRRANQKMKVLGNRGVGSSILLLDSDFRKDTAFVDVPVWTMDEYVAEQGLARPDFIKLDTQASEIKVLGGARNCLAGCKFVLSETWTRRVYGPETPLFHELASFMYAQNFCLYEILSLEEGRDADATLRWFDAVFINRKFSPFASSML